LHANTGREYLKTPGILSFLRSPEKWTCFEIMIKNAEIRVNDYSLPPPVGEIDEKIPFDKREIIVILDKIN
jgi:hypothetical protein